MIKKTYLTFLLCICISTYTFAQTAGQAASMNRLATALTTEICGCFNKHDIKNMSADTKKVLNKLAKKGTKSISDFETLLSKEEVDSFVKGVAEFNEEDSDFKKCVDKAYGKMKDSQDDIDNAMVPFKEDTIKFEKALEAEMSKIMKEAKACHKCLYFYLVVKAYQK